MVTAGRCAGFTLMECVISLAVLSICATTVMSTRSADLRSFARAHEETLAGRAAASQLEIATGAADAPAVGTTTFRTAQRFGGSDWGDGTQTVTVVEPGLFRVEVTVTWRSADGGDGCVRLATLVAREAAR